MIADYPAFFSQLNPVDPDEVARKVLACITNSNPGLLKRIPGLIDLTSLEGSDTIDRIQTLCANARKRETAAVCVYPVFVKLARTSLQGSAVRVAAVAGAFPSGQLPLPLKLEEIKFALGEGADEIDVVLPRGKFLEGRYAEVSDELAAMKQVCGRAHFKVILETGELETSGQIRNAGALALEAGADFIKTSTGKAKVNATLPAFCVMLESIHAYYQKTGIKRGIKAAGGIADPATALHYMQLTGIILGKEWLVPELFRFGASRLLEEV